MAIIGPLPFILVDGTLADAVPLMADLNWIVSQVNANVQPGPAQVSYVYITQSFGGPGAMSNGVAQTQFVTGASPVVVVDSLVEFTAANGRFTANNTGWYRSTAVGQISTSGVTFTDVNLIYSIKNGVNTAVTQFAAVGTAVAATSLSTSATSDGIVSLNANDYLQVVMVPRFSGGAPVAGYFGWVVQRVA